MNNQNGTIEVPTTTALEKVITESGLQINEGNEIKASYLPFLERLSNISEQRVKINFEAPAGIDEKIAKDLRIQTMRIRTDAEKLKDDRKKIHLLKGNLEQASFNIIKASCLLIEEAFTQVEKAREIAEKKRKELLKAERLIELQPYITGGEVLSLGEMSDNDYFDLLTGLKLAHEAKIEAEKKAETDRVEKEKRKQAHIDREYSVRDFGRFFEWDKSHEETSDEDFNLLIEKAKKAKSDYDLKQERIKAENEKLKLESEAKDKQFAAEKAKADAERKAMEAKAQKEREAAEVKLKAEREATAKLQAELKAKADAELKAKKDAADKLESELSKGDKAKFQDFINDLKALKTKYNFKAKKYQQAHASGVELIEKTIVYLSSKI